MATARGALPHNSVPTGRRRQSHDVVVAIALRTYRFIGESRIEFLVRECVDSSRVLVSMERPASRRERCQLLLSGEDWRQLCALNPFGAAATRPDAVRMEMHFRDENDYGDSLTIGRSARSGRMSVRMHCGVPGREDVELTIGLTRWQWRYLTALDLAGRPYLQGHHANRAPDAGSPSSRLRMVPRAQPPATTPSEPAKS